MKKTNIAFEVVSALDFAEAVAQVRRALAADVGAALRRVVAACSRPA